MRTLMERQWLAWCGVVSGQWSLWCSALWYIPGESICPFAPAPLLFSYAVLELILHCTALHCNLSPRCALKFRYRTV